MVAKTLSRRAVVGRGLLAWLLAAIVLRGVVLQPELCGDPVPAEARAAAVSGVGWLMGNQRADGSYLYRFDRERDRDLGGYNIVRHAGVIVALEQAATAEIAGAAAAADEGTAWAVTRVIPMGEGLALADDNPRAAVSVGASALWAVALAERRQRTDDPQHDDLMIELGRFVAGSVQPDGSVPARYERDSGRLLPGSWSKFYTGEAFWALARLHLLFPDEGFGPAAERIAAYLPDRDDREGWWPAIPDHWAAYGFATMTTWPEPPTMDERQLAYVRRQAALQSVQIRYESTRDFSRWSHLTRGRPTLGAGLGTIGEALDQWWRVAQTDERLTDLQPILAERARCVAGVIIDRQAQPQDPGATLRSTGAWFQFGVTQMDDQQHTVSALLNVSPILGGPS